MRCSAYTAYTPPRGRVRLSKNLAEDVRDRAAGGVCGGQKAHRAFNQQAFETFLNVSKAAQRGENTFSTRWACGNRRRPRADHRSAPHPDYNIPPAGIAISDSPQQERKTALPIAIISKAAMAGYSHSLFLSVSLVVFGVFSYHKPHI